MVYYHGYEYYLSISVMSMNLQVEYIIWQYSDMTVI